MSESERPKKKRLTPKQRKGKDIYQRRKFREGFASLRPLSVTDNFLSFAAEKGWSDSMTDCAALVMHRYLTLRQAHGHKNGWVEIPYQNFIGMLGKKNYRYSLQKLTWDGFIEENKRRLYLAGSFSKSFRLNSCFRGRPVSASYVLRTEPLKKLYLNARKKISQATLKKRKEAFLKRLPKIIERRKEKLRISPSHLTENNIETAKRIIENSCKLKLKPMSPGELDELARKRYHLKKHHVDIGTLAEVYQIIQDGVLSPKSSIDRQGRLYVPYSRILREMWRNVTYRGEHLVSVDVKTSQMHCLLALLKDISQNYFPRGGTHNERLERCQFEKQISTIPGLEFHLCISSFFMNSMLGVQCYDGNNYIDKVLLNWAKIFKKVKNATVKNGVLLYHAIVPQYDYYQFNIKNTIGEIPDKDLTLYVFQEEHSKPIQHESFQNVMDILRRCKILRDFSPNDGDALATETDAPFSEWPLQNAFFPSQEEIDAFEHHLGNDIYSTLIEKVGLKKSSGEPLDRSSFKDDFFFPFYYGRPLRRKSPKLEESDPRAEKLKGKIAIREAFGDLLPSILYLIDIAKSKAHVDKFDTKGTEYKKLPTAMQAIESTIMLDCCENLFKKYPRMFFITLHDSIKCLPKDEQKVRDELERSWKKYLVSPKFETETYGPSNK